MGVYLARVRAMLVTLTVVAIEALGTLGHADEERCSRQGKHYYQGSHGITPPSIAEEGRRGLSNTRGGNTMRSEEHTSELQSQSNLVCRLLLEKKKKKINK